MAELESISPVEAARGPKSYLFYGPPGAGKTIFAAKHPGTRKLWLDMDQKLGEIEQLPNASSISVWSPHEPLGNPDGVEIPYSPDPKNVHAGKIATKKPLGYEKLVNVTNELILQSRNGGCPYDLIVLDSLTSASDHWVRLLMYTHKVSFMTERLWGIYLAGMTEYINGFLQLPCERIAICHDKSVVDEDTRVERIRPAIAGQLGNNLTRYFTEAYYFLGRDRSGSYRLQTITDGRIAARTSRGLEPQMIAAESLYSGTRG